MTLGALVALALDGAIAVLTAEDLEPLGLHWMPTLAGDRQMVLADGKVLFQGQEVATPTRRRAASPTAARSGRLRPPTSSSA